MNSRTSKSNPQNPKCHSLTVISLLLLLFSCWHQIYAKKNHWDKMSVQMAVQQTKITVSLYIKHGIVEWLGSFLICNLTCQYESRSSLGQFGQPTKKCVVTLKNTHVGYILGQCWGLTSRKTPMPDHFFHG